MEQSQPRLAVEPGAIMLIRVWLLILVFSVGVRSSFRANAQDSGDSDSSGSGASESSSASSSAVSAEAATSEEAVSVATSDSTADRTRLNLLGEVNSEQGEGRRNENVRLTLIDNNVLRELNERLGISATAVKNLQIDRSYWATEFGGPPGRPLHVPPARATRVNGNLYLTHTNSAVSARSFFQVGAVQPARSNDYGVTVGMPAWDGAALTLNGSQTRNKGQVNGNVLVPALDERTPLTDDPARRAFVQRIMDAYPAEIPNRTDINPRALNTNAPQDIANGIAFLCSDEANFITGHTLVIDGGWSSTRFRPFPPDLHD